MRKRTFKPKEAEMSWLQNISRLQGLVFVVLCMVPACVDDIRTVGSNNNPQSSESTEQQSQPSKSTDQSLNGGVSSVCGIDNFCQKTGVHCCTANRLFAPADCSGDFGSSGYVCGTCIPAQFCQPTGDHCCSGRHVFNPTSCGGTVDGKQYSGYECL